MRQAVHRIWSGFRAAIVKYRATLLQSLCVHLSEDCHAETSSFKSLMTTVVHAGANIVGREVKPIELPKSGADAFQWTGS